MELESFQNLDVSQSFSVRVFVKSMSMGGWNSCMSLPIEALWTKGSLMERWMKNLLSNVKVYLPM
jgi:hypothetical protein